MVEINFLSMSKPKIRSNMINVKVSDVSEICVTCRLFQKQEMVKRSLDARTPKTLISHLSTQVNLIQYFRCFSRLFKSHTYSKI